MLECIFQTDPLPRRTLRSELATQLGITPRCVQVWFQNRRQKWKSIHHTAGQPVPALSNSTQSRYNNLGVLLAPSAGGTAPLQQQRFEPPTQVPLDRQSTPATPETLVGSYNEPIALPLAPSHVDHEPRRSDRAEAPSAASYAASDPSASPPAAILPPSHAHLQRLPPVAPSAAESAGGFDASMPLMMATQPPPLVMPAMSPAAMSPAAAAAAAAMAAVHGATVQPDLCAQPPRQACCVGAASQPAATEGLMPDAAGAAAAMQGLTPLRLVGLQPGTGAPIFECLPAEAVGAQPPMPHSSGGLMRWTPQGALLLPYTLVAGPAVVQPIHTMVHTMVQQPMPQPAAAAEPMPPLVILPAPGVKPSPPTSMAPSVMAPMPSDAVAAAAAAVQEELAAYAMPQAVAHEGGQATFMVHSMCLPP